MKRYISLTPYWVLGNAFLRRRLR